ncbi:hypothetical protein [Peribacillus glennii]|uniref:Uncharacterized protein n=1 Tax=Peribacillus glennii TaxID=2303991 RepID=A0A372LHQ9_9BACI|nr:hypothetical protein [Peribacillus glennii]RFU65502.1 hypothetical protein D0466_06370 [Peribacillus glennii]
MGIKRADANEVLELLGEITARLEQLEETISENYNTGRCQLWENQMAMVHSAQVAFEKAEKDWKVKEIENKSYILRKESAMNQQMPMNPKLGF